ncbi:MAG: Rieske 2Fe-2S domain-containing protein [Planctomycetes bacterium]|nr:Rieske 2Fe-2S domain-containing protein [Planctomycetota bacterium]
MITPLRTQDSGLRSLLDAYDPTLPLARAATIPSAWYTDARIAELERRTVFGNTWQFVGRLDQLQEPGRFITADVGGEPIVVTRGNDGKLHACFNVCRHHAAIIATEVEGTCGVLRCPYHGWTYDFDGSLKGAPEFDGVEWFDKKQNSLVPVRVDTWENLVFVHLGTCPPCGTGLLTGQTCGTGFQPVSSPSVAPIPSLADYLGDIPERTKPLNLSTLKFFERRSWPINCNWKVYVDNYLDGGYHIPHLHKGLNTVLEYSDYLIETRDRYCLQWSPMKQGKDAGFAAVRRGDTAYYYWLHPNFMLNWYEGVMDTNLVIPLAVDKCLVVFDFYFDDISPAAEERNRKSVEVGTSVQQEDVDICESVQRGLQSRAYDTGRLSVRREAGEHLFHRLLHDNFRLAEG